MDSPIVLANSQLSLAFAMAQERFCWQSFKSAAGTEFLDAGSPAALWEVELIYRNGDVKTLIPDALPQVKQTCRKACRVRLKSG